MNYKTFIEWAKERAKKEGISVYHFLSCLAALRQDNERLRKTIKEQQEQIATAQQNEYTMAKFVDKVMKDVEEKTGETYNSSKN